MLIWLMSHLYALPRRPGSMTNGSRSQSPPLVPVQIGTNIRRTYSAARVVRQEAESHSVTNAGRAPPCEIRRYGRRTSSGTAAQLQADLGLLHDRSRTTVAGWPGAAGGVACVVVAAGRLDVFDVVAAPGYLARRRVCYGGFLNPGEQDPDVAERSYQGQYQGCGDYI